MLTHSAAEIRYNRYNVKTSYKVTIFFHYICLGMYIIQWAPVFGG